MYIIRLWNNGGWEQVCILIDWWKGKPKFVAKTFNTWDKAARAARSYGCSYRIDSI